MGMQALDALTLYHLAYEATDLTHSAKVNKVQHLSPHEWVLQFWGAKAGASRLYINLSAPVAAAWLTEDIRPFTQKQFTQPTGLSLLLRKHLLGARVQETLVDPGERVWTWVFRQINELGNTVTWHLILELMGKHSNMMLVDADTRTMVGLAHSVSETMSTIRPLRPGTVYVPPPKPAKPSLWTFTPDALTQLLSAGPPYAPLLRDHVLGCSQYLFETMLPDALSPSAAACKTLSLLTASSLMPSCHASGEGYSLHPDPSANWHLIADTAFPVSQLIQRYYQAQCLQLQLRVRQHRLHQVIQARFAKLQRHVNQLDQQTDNNVDALTLADALMAQLYSLPAQLGPDHQLMLSHAETGEPVTLTLPLPPNELPPQTTWMQTIQALYARARKQKAQSQFHLARRQLIANQMEQMDIFRLWVSAATDIPTLDHLSEELTQLTIPSQHPGKTSAKPDRKKSRQPVSGKQLAEAELRTGYTRFDQDNATVMIGKTQTANAHLLSKIARPKDWWFHARQMPGSHVLVKTDADQLSDAVIALAAGLAAYYSTGRDNKRVPVVYTQARHVRAIPNSYPGHVTYKAEQEVFVEPQLPADV
jgi:predicted ribosome quality control (RQC) complex YloA/Tae2 family protein